MFPQRPVSLKSTELQAMNGDRRAHGAVCVCVCVCVMLVVVVCVCMCVSVYVRACIYECVHVCGKRADNDTNLPSRLMCIWRAETSANDILNNNRLR